MRTYISGKISGLPFEQVQEKFNQAEELLHSLNIEPVNPLKNGLDRCSSWESHMIRDIEILLKCDSILMLDGWMTSKGARIEKVIAEEMDLIILFESYISGTNKDLQTIKDAIQDVTGLRYDEYTAKGRNRRGFYARMMLIYLCRMREKMDLHQIAMIVNRDHSTVAHSLKTYCDEIGYNGNFRKMAQRVNEILNCNVSE